MGEHATPSSIKCGEFVTVCGTVSFWRRVVLCRGITFVSYHVSPPIYSILNVVVSVVWSVMTHWSCLQQVYSINSWWRCSYFSCVYLRI